MRIICYCCVFPCLDHLPVMHFCRAFSVAWFCFSSNVLGNLSIIEGEHLVLNLFQLVLKSAFFSSMTRRQQQYCHSCNEKRINLVPLGFTGAWCISSEVQVQGNKLYRVKVFDNIAHKKTKWGRKQKGYQSPRILNYNPRLRATKLELSLTPTREISLAELEEHPITAMGTLLLWDLGKISV